MSKPEYLDGLDLDSVDDDFDTADSEATKQNVRAIIRLVLRTIKKGGGDDATDAKEFTDNLLKQAKEEGHIKLSSNSGALVPADSGDVTLRTPADAAALGTDLLRVFGGNSNRAQLAVDFFGKVMAIKTGPEALAYFATVLDDLSREKYPEQIVIDNMVPTLRSVQTLREQKIEHESAMYDLLRAIHGGSFATGTVQEMVDNAKRALAARRAVAPTPLPAPAPTVVNDDSHYIRLLGNASGISAGSIADFGRYAQHVVDEMRKNANAALDTIGNKLSTRRTSADNDIYGAHLVTIIETRLDDLAKAENDLKAKDTELNKKIGEFNDLKRKFDDLTKKSDVTRTHIVKIADKNDISYHPGATPEKIVEEMIDQKGGTFSKLSL